MVLTSAYLKAVKENVWSRCLSTGPDSKPTVTVCLSGCYIPLESCKAVLSLNVCLKRRITHRFKALPVVLWVVIISLVPCDPGPVCECLLVPWNADVGKAYSRLNNIGVPI